VLREGDRPTTTKLKAKKGDHMRHGGSGEASSGGASCSFHHPGSAAITGPSPVGERPSGGRQHLPPSCYPPAGARKKIVPPAPPLPVEKRRFQLFTAADDVVSDLRGVDPGPGAKLLGVKLEQRQEEAMSPPEPPALSSDSFPGRESTSACALLLFWSRLWHVRDAAGGPSKLVIVIMAGPSGTQSQGIEDGPTAPDLQLDWLSSSSDSDDTDDDSGIEVVSVKYKQSAQRVSFIRCIAVMNGETRSEDMKQSPSGMCGVYTGFL
jgi:hypothetical protein